MPLNPFPWTYHRHDGLTHAEGRRVLLTGAALTTPRPRPTPRPSPPWASCWPSPAASSRSTAYPASPTPRPRSKG